MFDILWGAHKVPYHNLVFLRPLTAAWWIGLVLSLVHVAMFPLFKGYVWVAIISSG